MALLGVISLSAACWRWRTRWRDTGRDGAAGWVFTLLGALQIVQAFRVTGWPGFIWSLLFGILVLAVGLSLVFNPLAGMVSLTLLVRSCSSSPASSRRCILALRPISGWGWVLASGLISIRSAS